MATNGSMSHGKFVRGLGTCIFPSCIVGSLHKLTEFARAVLKHSHVPCMCINPMWVPVACRSLFLDIQVVTLLLSQFA